MNNRRHIWRGDVGLVAFWSYAPIVSKLMTLMMPLPQEKPWQNSSNKFFKLHVAGVDLQNLLRLTLQRFGLKTNHRIQSAKEQQAAWTPQKASKSPGRVWRRNLTVTSSTKETKLMKLAQKSQKNIYKMSECRKFMETFLLAFCSVGFNCLAASSTGEFWKTTSPRSAGMQKWLTSTTSVSAESKTWNPEADAFFFWIIQKDL